jgi:hypothetical protein
MLREADASGPDNGDAARWIRIAQALLLPPEASKRLELSPGRKVSGDECSQAFIQVLERPTGRTALILWRDPGRCYCADQLWVRGVAGYGGRCALSGQSVGGNTHQLPSSCRKKNNARAPSADEVSTHT